MTSLSAGMESRMQSAWETPYETCCEIQLEKNNMKSALKFRRQTGFYTETGSDPYWRKTHMRRGGFLVAAREMPSSKENKNTKQSVRTQYTITHLFQAMVPPRRSQRRSKQSTEEAAKAEEAKKTKAAQKRPSKPKGDKKKTSSGSKDQGFPTSKKLSKEATEAEEAKKTKAATKRRSKPKGGKKKISSGSKDQAFPRMEEVRAGEEEEGEIGIMKAAPPGATEPFAKVGPKVKEDVSKSVRDANIGGDPQAPPPDDPPAPAIVGDEDPQDTVGQKVGQPKNSTNGEPSGDGDGGQDGTGKAQEETKIGHSDDGDMAESKDGNNTESKGTAESKEKSESKGTAESKEKSESGQPNKAAAEPGHATAEKTGDDEEPQKRLPEEPDDNGDHFGPVETVEEVSVVTGKGEVSELSEFSKKNSADHEAQHDKGGFEMKTKDPVGADEEVKFLGSIEKSTFGKDGNSTLKICNSPNDENPTPPVTTEKREVATDKSVSNSVGWVLAIQREI
jgi:hypothetical protein